MRFLPESNNRADWPRLVARAVNTLIGRTNWASLEDYADDTAAAAGGVPVGGLYHNAGQVRVRIS